MKIYQIAHPSELKEKPVPASVALGNFDGLHAGHQAVIRRAIERAKEFGLARAVMTFEPHPKVVLGLYQRPAFLTPLPEKLSLMANLGLDLVYVIRFTPETALLSPAQFIEEYIAGLNIKQVVTGFDFRFGHKGEGDINTLKEWAREHNQFEVEVVTKVGHGERKISSSLVRSLLAEGDVEQVAHLLRRPYSIAGQVVHGDKRGRRLGFPTANIQLSNPYVIPRHGVYAVYALIGEKRWPGVVNIGEKPTFRTGLPASTIEVHLIDFEGDLYGQNLSIQFIKFLRPERRFESVDALISQIKKDCESAISLLADSTTD